MSLISRRRFSSTAAAFALAPLSRLQPETILYNGKIWMGIPGSPFAQALALSQGRVWAAGDNSDVLRLATGYTKKIDLGMKTVLPGFNDAHSHPVDSGIDFISSVPCEGSSIKGIQADLRARAAKTPTGEWVRGFLYDDGKTPRPLNKHDLDEVTSDHPVVVAHRGGHTLFANSLALRLAGISDASRDPVGGLYERDASGRLTGRIGDNAMAPFEKIAAYHASRHDYRESAALVTKAFAAKGITSACDAAGGAKGLLGYQDARDEGQLRCRIYCHIFVGEDFDQVLKAGIRTGFGDNMVRIGALKQAADGSISERTAWLSQPYADLSPPYSGLQSTTRETLFENAKRAHLAGWQLAIHANGDLAIDQVLGIYEELQRDFPRPDARYRLEHCTLVNPQLVQRMQKLKALPIPFAAYVYFHGDVMHFYGEERLQRMFAMRWFIDAGIPVPSSSDYTASPSDAMMFLHSMVNRTGKDGHPWGLNQRITLHEAIRCGTGNGAYCAFEETEKGTLEPGKLADLIVLGKDPWATDPLDLVNIPIERTLLGGKWVFES
jgi:predicted amidohydrolase YtcJ